LKEVWVYIKSNNLQNPLNKKEVLADDSLKDLFGKDKVTIPEVLLGA
jgi:chromatin remodeling complex protein RSC6